MIIPMTNFGFTLRVNFFTRSLSPAIYPESFKIGAIWKYFPKVSIGLPILELAFFDSFFVPGFSSISIIHTTEIISSIPLINFIFFLDQGWFLNFEFHFWQFSPFLQSIRTDILWFFNKNIDHIFVARRHIINKTLRALEIRSLSLVQIFHVETCFSIFLNWSLFYFLVEVNQIYYIWVKSLSYLKFCGFI